MKNISYLLPAVALMVFTGCGPNKKSDVNTTLPTTPANSTFNNPPPANSSDQIQLSSPPSQTGTPAMAVALNPAHGMPNHRCDIAVGAPLNSAPQTNPTAAPRLPTPTLNLPAQGSYAADTNPPHGQPGHDCSIAVGAPLKR